MIINIKDHNTLQVDDFKLKCVVGKKGFTRKKVEGDLKTPIGLFDIEDLYYRSDRVKKPNTRLRCIKINKKMGWCDDILSKKYYNKRIRVTKKVKHEKLFRKDNLYDIIIVINYNTRPIVKNKGSAIFIHLAKKNYSGTMGCIGLKKKDLLEVLKTISKKTKIKIVA